MITTKQFIKSAKKAFRMIRVKFKPLTIHTEAIFYDDVWKIIKAKIKNREVHTWYLMTPMNYQDMKNYYWLSESNKEIELKMKKRFREMKKMGARLQLHLHLHPRLLMTYSEQEKLIKDSVNWLKKEVDINVTEIAFGWWRHNKDSEKAAKKYGLKIINFDDYNSMHDFDWVISSLGETPSKN